MKREVHMVKSKNYDWSALDRQLLVGFQNFAKCHIVEISHTPSSFVSIFRKLFRYFEVPINVRLKKDPTNKINDICVGGTYYAYDDKDGRRSINLEFFFNPDCKIVKVTLKRFKEIINLVADTILHEMIHMRQWRRRNYKAIPGYESSAAFASKRKEQNYLGHPDEIDAYAFNIAIYLNTKLKRERDIVNYLNRDTSDKRLAMNSYIWYLRTFDNNHNHKVIKRLKKKIIYYLPNAKLGKPYKTSDWLK